MTAFGNCKHRFERQSLRKRAVSGSAAVEFAIIAPVFLSLLFATIETGMTYFANVTLTNAIADAGRLIRTGQAQTGGMSQAAFRTAICGKVSFLMSCAADQLYVDVRAFTSFGGSAFPDALDSHGNLNPSLNNYNTGASSRTAGTSDIVLVRAFYKWQLYTPGISEYFANMGGHTRLISSSVAFRNEPY